MGSAEKTESHGQFMYCLGTEKTGIADIAVLRLAEGGLSKEKDGPCAGIIYNASTRSVHGWRCGSTSTMN